MKKVLLSFLLSATCLLAIAQNNETAIKSVLNHETEAFYARDAKKMVSYWHITPQTSMYVLLSPSTVYVFNADSLHNYKLTGAPVTVNLDKLALSRTNWKFCINGNSAYVTFDSNLGDAQQK